MAEVRFLGAIRKAAGAASFGIDAGTVEELLEQLWVVMRPSFQEFVFQDGELAADVEIEVNGQSIAALDGLKTALTPFDQVTLRVTGKREVLGG
jgi:molybdopterin converting factor small subunit